LRFRMAEKGLRLLRKLGLVDNMHRFKRTDAGVIVPLARMPTENESAVLREEIGELVIQSISFQEAKEKTRSLSTVLQDRIPDQLKSKLPRSFDVIGDIAILDIPEGSEPFSEAIARGVMEVDPHVRLVLKESSQVGGAFRTRRFEVQAGSGGTETVHQEYSCRYRLDVSRVYFNPRLSSERMRVARQVRPGELVVDMFAGVGPYSILIAKLQPRSTVYSVDINPSAVEYLKENVFANHVADRVVPMLGDVEELARVRLRGIADRVVMNFPSESSRYLAAASRILKDEGGLMHFYTFAARDERLGTIVDSFRSTVESQGRKVESVQFCKVIKEVAPNRVQVAIDALVGPRA
jgi:tRNA (guanine37-N1)-methyltransferase